MHHSSCAVCHPDQVIGVLAPVSAVLPSGATVDVDTDFPFGDDAIITVDATASSAAVPLRVRVPAWATAATLDGAPVANGTFASVACAAGAVTTVALSLAPAVRVEARPRGFSGGV